ncbi:MAG TPA: hypothetical protein DCZ95_03195 [Verrucomicrobia bacterium]|nr:MAG: hypothetical protein A2X46_06840 [Lentisphaerae bacterium GWF2_57_35]HBA83078.1 hypothetical protein [Verrucomicrobiota bacterium]
MGDEKIMLFSLIGALRTARTKFFFIRWNPSSLFSCVEFGSDHGNLWLAALLAFRQDGEEPCRQL